MNKVEDPTFCKHSPENVKIISSHKETVCLFGKFEENDINHYFTLSTDGILKEIDISKEASLIDVKLQRPSPDFLNQNDHQEMGLKIGEFYEITSSKLVKQDTIKVISKEVNSKFKKSYLILGYEDGLICVWSQISDLLKHYKTDEFAQKTNNTNNFNSNITSNQVRFKQNDSGFMTIENNTEDVNNNNNNNTAKMSVFSSNNKSITNSLINTERENKSELNVSHNNTNALSISSKKNPKDLNEIRKKVETYYVPYDFPYVNIYALELLFIGQNGRITCMEVIDNYLISCSTSKQIKVWSFSEGFSIYNFNLDIIFTNIIITLDKKKNSIAKCLSEDNYLFEINLNKDPISIKSYQTQYSPINSNSTNVKVETEEILIDPKAKKKPDPKKMKPVKKIKDFVLLGGDNFNINVLSSDLSFINSLRVDSYVEITNIFQFKEYFVLVLIDSLAIVSINFDTKKINKLIELPISLDRIKSSFFINESILVVSSEDKFVYMIDVKRELDLYNRRLEMIKEDKESNIMNIAYLKSLTKKKKKGSTSKAPKKEEKKDKDKDDKKKSDKSPSKDKTKTTKKK